MSNSNLENSSKPSWQILQELDAEDKGFRLKDKVWYYDTNWPTAYSEEYPEFLHGSCLTEYFISRIDTQNFLRSSLDDKFKIPDTEFLLKEKEREVKRYKITNTIGRAHKNLSENLLFRTKEDAIFYHNLLLGM